MLDQLKALKLLDICKMDNGYYEIKYDDIPAFVANIDDRFKDVDKKDFSSFISEVWYNGDCLNDDDNRRDEFFCNSKDKLLSYIIECISRYINTKKEKEEEDFQIKQQLNDKIAMLNYEENPNYITHYKYFLENRQKAFNILRKNYPKGNYTLYKEDILAFCKEFDVIFAKDEQQYWYLNSFLKDKLEKHLSPEEYYVLCVNDITIEGLYNKLVDLIFEFEHSIDKERQKNKEEFEKRKEEQAEQDAYFENIPKEELPPEEEIIEQEQEEPKEEQQQTTNKIFKKETLIKKGFSQEQIYNLKTALEQNNLFVGSAEAWQNLFSDDIQDNLTITAKTKPDCIALIIALQEEGIFNKNIYSLIERNHCFKNNDDSYLTQQDISKNKTDGGKKIKDKYGVNTDKIKKIIKEVKKGSNVKKQ